MSQFGDSSLGRAVAAYVVNRSLANAGLLEKELRLVFPDEARQTMRFIIDILIGYRDEAQEQARLGATLKELVEVAMTQPTNSKTYNMGNVQGVGQIGDNTVTDSVVSGNVGVTQTLTDCFNKISQSPHGDEIKAKLEALHKQVEELVTRIPDVAKKEQVASDYQALVKEATATKPRKSWLELSANGLKEAANTVKELTGPIVSTVTTLLGLYATIAS